MYIVVIMINEVPDVHQPHSVIGLLVNRERWHYYVTAFNWSAMCGHRTLKLAQAVDKEGVGTWLDDS